MTMEGPNGIPLMAQPMFACPQHFHKAAIARDSLVGCTALFTPYGLLLAGVTHLCYWPGPCKKLQKCFFYVL